MHRPVTTGHFELGPEKAVPGGVWVDDGRPVRMVLRPERDGSYEVIGDALFPRNYGLRGDRDGVGGS